MSGIKEKTGFGSIRVIFPCDIQRITELRIVKKANDHARVFISGLVAEEQKDRYIDLASSSDTIVIQDVDDNGDRHRILFHGLVSDISFRSVRGIYHLELEGISHSIKMDLKKKSRSFQHQKMPYHAMFKQILSEYSGGDYIDNATGSARLGQFTIQYQETDWMFLKRMASRFEAVIIPEATADAPKLWFGVPEGKRWILDKTSYHVRKTLEEYRQCDENGNPKVQGYSEISYTVVTNQHYSIGDIVQFQGKELTVVESVAQLKDGVVTMSYLLSPEFSIRQNQHDNEYLSGSALEGKVIDVDKDTVRVHLTIDSEQNKEEACWIRYESMYSAEGNSGFYCMPELGDTVQIYFPSSSEEEAVAIGSVSRGQGASQVQNPEVKGWSTKHGKGLKLGTTDLTFTARENNIFIKLDDGDGVHIESGHTVSIASKSDLEFRADQRLGIQAQEGIFLQCNQSSIVLDGEADIYAPALNLAGLVKSPVFVADLEPVPEPPLMSIDAFNGSSQVAGGSPTKGLLNTVMDGVQTALSLAGMIPAVGLAANAVNTGITAMRGSTQGAALSLAASVPFIGRDFNPYEAGVNKLTSDILGKMNPSNMMSESLLMRGANGDIEALNEWKKQMAALPVKEEKLTQREKNRRAREAIQPTNEFLKFMKENIADPFAEGMDWFLYDTDPGRFVNRFSYTAASMVGPPVVDQPTTGNEIADIAADVLGGVSGVIVNPAGMGTNTQNLFTVSNKVGNSLANTKGGQLAPNLISKPLEKILSPSNAQKISQTAVRGAVTGSFHSASISLIQNKSSGPELLQAAFWGGAFGGLFGGIGGGLGIMWGKVLTTARQYTSQLKPSQIITGLKQAMQENVIREAPLKARKGLETRGYSRDSVSEDVNIVKYYRVQTKGEHGSFERMIVNDDGTISVVTKKSNLNVSAETAEHAEYFMQKKGEGSYIIEFEVDSWFHDMIKEYAIPQKYYRTNPLNQGRTAPKIVDPHQPGLSLELPPIWIDWIEELAKNAKILK
ncbi:contractile injection system protein, VgrG/Pvc8 family [Bacillus cereus]|nr:contractile injection system protein, VgrG/Pvc8 family [Bacillus cereus]